MSRKYKISTVRQADDAINDLNDNIVKALRCIDREFNRVRKDAEITAQRKSREEAERAKVEMQNKLNASIRGVNARINQVDEEQRQRLHKVANEIYDTVIEVNKNLHNEISMTKQELRNDMRSLEQRTNERIQQVNRHINSLANHVEKRFEEQQSQLNSHAKKLDNLTDTVNAILAQMADEKQKRKEAVSLASGVKQAAYGRIDIDRFNPLKSQEINRRMAALEANPDDEGTVARASEVILQIQMAEEEAMRNKIVYDAIHAEATAMLEKILEEVNKNREVVITYPDSPQDVAKIETDFWNRGEYSKLKSKLDTLKAELRQQPSLERIKEIMGEVAKGEVILSDMLDKAARSAILSENRVTITEDIVTALISQGWQVERMPDGRDAVNYLGGEDRDNDWREGVFAILNSMNGERISILVRPDESNENNEIVFHRNDNRSITDLEYIRSLERIKEQISKSGFKLGPTTTPADGGDTEIPEMTDARQMGKRGSAKKINQRARKR